MSGLTKKMIKAGFSKFDIADHLTTPGRMAAYLDAVIEDADGNQALVNDALNDVARAQKQNMTKLAAATGITRSSLYETLSPKGNPSFATMQKLAAALGLRLTFTAAK
jgi:probable addiction module antidote protein